SLLHLRRSFLLRVPLPGSVSAASSHGCSTAVALHHRRLLAMSLEFPLQPNKTPIWEPLNSDSSRGPVSVRQSVYCSNFDHTSIKQAVSHSAASEASF
ncbi:hypothetical protein LINGRAHAP2_LOCUS14008, partial [Linum grandiflorum]